MGNLSTALSIASGALLAQESALQVSSNNIANANTPGYSRQVANFDQSAPIDGGTVSIGDGVNLVGIQSVRDQLLTSSIQQQTSQQSFSDAQVSTLDQVQTLFPSSGSSLASDLSSFFTSLSGLSASPSSAATRQTVISSAQNLVGQFNSVAAGLSSTQSSLDTQVQTDTTQINQLSAQAATLNGEIAQQSNTGQDAGTLGDQLNQVELQLAGLTNISVTKTPEGDTLTTGDGSPLVIGTRSFALQTTAGAGGHQQVLDSTGANITSQISGGDLGGTIQSRDTSIAGLASSLDTLANQFATAFNAAQAKGFNQSGGAGAALFTVPTTVAGSAVGISLATTDPTAIAASSDGSSGSNGNVANLTAVQNSALPAGQSVTALSANLVYQVGTLTANATNNSAQVKLNLTQLTNQQSSVTGVSIDQESANLIRYQQAYQAAAQVVNTIGSLFQSTITMMNGA